MRLLLAKVKVDPLTHYTLMRKANMEAQVAQGKAQARKVLTALDTPITVLILVVGVGMGVHRLALASLPMELTHLPMDTHGTHSLVATQDIVVATLLPPGMAPVAMTTTTMPAGMARTGTPLLLLLLHRSMRTQPRGRGMTGTAHVQLVMAQEPLPLLHTLRTLPMPLTVAHRTIQAEGAQVAHQRQGGFRALQRGAPLHARQNREGATHIHHRQAGVAAILIPTRPTTLPQPVAARPSQLVVGQEEGSMQRSSMNGTHHHHHQASRGHMERLDMLHRTHPRLTAMAMAPLLRMPMERVQLAMDTPTHTPTHPRLHMP